MRARPDQLSGGLRQIASPQDSQNELSPDPSQAVNHWRGAQGARRPYRQSKTTAATVIISKIAVMT
jgi:hypothetical protein